MSRDDVFRAPKGVHDVLPPDSGRWTEIVARFAERAARYGYGLAITPMFEHVEVFHRVGEHTDVVAKEMYELTDKGGRRLALRPEGTASVVRAYVQHRPTPPWKVWYVAPNFRYERAQKGRYRQHWQLGVEALGVDDPDIDVEVIALLSGFYRDLGLSDVRLLLTSMGDAESRAPFVAALREHFLAHGATFGDEFVARVEANPMRVLDAKVEAWQDVIASAPQLPEFLSPDAADKFERVQAGLAALGIDVELAPRLVRGFDYYTGTTFEFQSAALDAAQSAVGATVSPKSSAGPRRRGSVSGRASSGSCWRWRRWACRARRAGSRCSSSTGSAPMVARPSGDSSKRCAPMGSGWIGRTAAARSRRSGRPPTGRARQSP